MGFIGTVITERAEGKLDSARKWYEKSLVIRERLTKTDPNNHAWQQDLNWVRARMVERQGVKKVKKEIGEAKGVK